MATRFMVTLKYVRNEENGVCRTCGGPETPCMTCAVVEREHVHLIETDGKSINHPGQRTGRVWLLSQNAVDDMGLADNFRGSRRTLITQYIAQRLRLPSAVQ